MAKTNCERCTVEIEDDEVAQCLACGLDGMCNKCLDDHECDTDEPVEE